MSKVKHIALVKFKDGTSEEQIKAVFDNILDVTETIPGIEDYVSGPNSSPEGLNQGFTHGLIMTFADAAARDAYLAHPEHERLKALSTPVTESLLVFDFEV
jgi:Stress responsive A/B Barrel Domain